MRVNYIKKKSDKEIIGIINSGIPFALMWLFLSLAYLLNDEIYEKGNTFMISFFAIPLLISGVFIFRTHFYSNCTLESTKEDILLKRNYLFHHNTELVKIDKKAISSIKIEGIKSHFLSSPFYILYINDQQESYEIWIMNYLFKSSKVRLSVLIGKIRPNIKNELLKKLDHDLSLGKVSKEYL